MLIYFVRHGESTANVESILPPQDPSLYPLTERGRQQAQVLAERLALIDFERAFSSDLLRAVQTAEIILDGRDIQLEINPLLREHDVGELVGRSDDEAWSALRGYFLAWISGDLETGPEDGESMADLQQRFVHFLDGLKSGHEDSSAAFLVVAHAGLLWGGLPFIFDNVDLEFIQSNGLDNGCLIVGQYQSEQWTCLEWNGQPLTR